MKLCPKCRQNPATITVQDDDGIIKRVCKQCYYDMKEYS